MKAAADRFPGEVNAFRARPVRATPYLDPPRAPTQVERERPHVPAPRKDTPEEAKRKKNQRRLEQGFGCDYCQDRGMINRYALRPEDGVLNASYDDEGRLILPKGFDARPGSRDVGYAGGTPGFCGGSTYFMAVGGLVYGATEVSCPYCRPREKRQRGFAKRRRSLSKRQKAKVQRNRALVALVRQSELEQNEEVASV